MIAGWLVIGSLAATPSPMPTDTTATLKDWALSRCIGKAAGAPFRADAFASAGALLERADSDVAVFNRMDALVDRALASRRSGSVPSRYETLKCLEMYHGGELDRIVRRGPGSR